MAGVALGAERSRTKICTRLIPNRDRVNPRDAASAFGARLRLLAGFRMRFAVNLLRKARSNLKRPRESLRTDRAYRERRFRIGSKRDADVNLLQRRPSRRRAACSER